MEYFNSDGLKLAYRVEGEGDPIVLVHGFASTHRANWIETGWSRALTDAGFRVILPDMRGHGASEVCYHADDYALGAMADDLVALLDHLGEAGADIMGYSMGAMVALAAAMAHPTRFDRVVAAGVAFVRELFAFLAQILSSSGDKEDSWTWFFRSTLESLFSILRFSFCLRFHFIA